ncbi:MAG: helix-turn-helix domain-containing protein [Deltaproteobacteria bacterium]|nr:MAG: helix-turn-helix domain-containing protein [Deltaproteobacteria bacterium]
MDRGGEPSAEPVLRLAAFWAAEKPSHARGRRAVEALPEPEPEPPLVPMLSCPPGSEMPEGRRRGRPAGVVVDNELMRSRRKALALSQSDLAERARMGARTVRAAEKGDPVSTDTAMQLAVTLGLPYVQLVRKSPEELQNRLLERGYALLDPPEPWVERDELASLTRLLTAEKGGLVVLEGPAGIGKSSAARWLANEVMDEFPDGAIWLAAAKLDEPGRLHRVQRDVAACLGFAELLPDPDLVTGEAFDRAFAARLWSRKRLLVLDDVQDARHVQRLLEPEHPQWMLATTSSRYVADQLGGHRHRIERWSTADATRLLERVVDDHRTEADPEGVEALAERSGGLPLIARQMGEALRRRRYTAPTDYAAEIEGAGIEGLGTEDHARIGALYVFQDRPFSLPFARVATGLSEVGTRLLLEQLSDLYLLREVPGPTRRFALDSASRGIHFWDSQESQRAMNRLIAAAPDLGEELAGDPIGGDTNVEAAARLDADLPTLGLILDRMTREVLGDSPRAARSPADVPSPLRADLPVGRALRAMRSLLIYQPPDEAGAWLTAALSAARDQHNDEDVRDASWMLMVWWWLRRQRHGAASEWCEPAVRAAREVGPPERVASALLFAAAVKQYAEGTQAQLHYLAQAAELGENDALESYQRACALGSYAVALFLEGDIEQAEALTERGLAIIEGSPDRVVWAELVLNLGAIRLARGGTLPPADQIREAVRLVTTTFAGSTLLEAQVFELARMLGVDPRKPMPTAGQVFYAVPAELVNSRLVRIAQMLIDLGHPVEGVHYEGSRDTPIGRFSSITTPFAPRQARPAMAMALLAPVEPFRRLLSEEGRKAAMDFVVAVRGPHHPLHRALESM